MINRLLRRATLSRSQRAVDHRRSWAPVDSWVRSWPGRASIGRMEIEVLTWQQLVRRAGSAAHARRLVKDKLWWRVLRNAYVERVHLDGPATRLAAARVVLPAGAALSHRAALW